MGDNGCSKEMRLHSGDDDFRRGATDKFTVTAPDVGPNKKAVIRLVGLGCRGLRGQG